ncbi:MAG: hypothetical protein WC942_10305 [Clostridia bacterium]|jgi:hypothetical protein
MIQFDAESIKARLIERLKAKESWANILFYSTNQRLIDIFAEELAYNMLYDELLTREIKWSFARQISSLMAETKFFNYYPHRKIAASGLLRISSSKTFDQSYGYNIPIPSFTTFSSGNIDFCTIDTTTLLNSENYKDITIIQGTPKSETFIASGDLYESFTILNDSIAENIIEVYVNSELWEKIDSIREAEEVTSKVYVVDNLNDFSGIDISFGNDYFGKKLSLGDTVHIKYVETLGLNGNIGSSNIITTVKSTLYDTEGEEVDMYCNNIDSIIGGDNIEDIESIRANAPKAYQSNDRAITKEDYKYLLESFFYIKKATVWGEVETNEDLGNLPGTYLPVEENVVHVSCITTSDSQISSTQESDIRDEINEKKAPTDIVVFEPVNFIYLVFNIDLYVSDKKYTLANVVESVRSTLADDYSIDKLDFKQPIRHSDYISKVDMVNGVDYHDTVISYYKYETFNTAYEADIIIEMANIKPSSVKISASFDNGDYFPIAFDDGFGLLVGESGYTVTASTINYSTGLGVLLVTDGLTEVFSNYIIKVEFEVNSTNILPTKRYQMISYGDSNITAQYTD